MPFVIPTKDFAYIYQRVGSVPEKKKLNYFIINKSFNLTHTCLFAARIYFSLQVLGIYLPKMLFLFCFQECV